jgi:hypothetical protein
MAMDDMSEGVAIGILIGAGQILAGLPLEHLRDIMHDRRADALRDNTWIGTSREIANVERAALYAYLLDGACQLAGTATTLAGNARRRARYQWDHPKVIVLCGSTRFKDEINAQNARLTLAGNIVISMGVFGHVDMPDARLNETNSSRQKIALDELHKRKIDLADSVFVVNPGGYIGESTASEIRYAKARRIPVEYLEPPSVSS